MVFVRIGSHAGSPPYHSCVPRTLGEKGRADKTDGAGGSESSGKSFDKTKPRHLEPKH